jgi:hypothetical protein
MEASRTLHPAPLPSETITLFPSGGSRNWFGRLGEQSLLVRFEVFTAMTIKNIVFWDVAPRGSGLNRRFGGTYRLYLQGR